MPLDTEVTDQARPGCACIRWVPVNRAQVRSRDSGAVAYTAPYCKLQSSSDNNGHDAGHTQRRVSGGVAHEKSPPPQKRCLTVVAPSLGRRHRMDPEVAEEPRPVHRRVEGAVEPVRGMYSRVPKGGHRRACGEEAWEAGGWGQSEVVVARSKFQIPNAPSRTLPPSRHCRHMLGWCSSSPAQRRPAPSWARRLVSEPLGAGAEHAGWQPEHRDRDGSKGVKQLRAPISIRVSRRDRPDAGWQWGRRTIERRGDGETGRRPSSQGYSRRSGSPPGTGRSPS